MPIATKRTSPKRKHPSAKELWYTSITHGIAYARQMRLLTPAFDRSCPVIKVISGKIGVVVVVRDWPSGGLVRVAVLGPICGMSLGARLSI